MDNTNSPIKSVEMTFEILQAIVTIDEAGVSRISEEIDAPTSTVYDHLKTLETLGYVIKENQTYRLSGHFLEFSDRMKKGLKIYRVGKPEVDKLADQTGEHANLLIEENGQGLLLHQQKGDKAVRLEMVTGERLPLHATALGKAILANLPDKDVEEIIDRHGLPEVTANTITDQAELFEELQDIRERGYATEQEEYMAGMYCIGAPVTTSDRILGSVSVSGPAGRMQGPRFESELPEIVLRASNIIEVNITHP